MLSKVMIFRQKEGGGAPSDPLSEAARVSPSGLGIDAWTLGHGGGRDDFFDHRVSHPLDGGRRIAPDSAAFIERNRTPDAVLDIERAQALPQGDRVKRV